MVSHETMKQVLEDTKANIKVLQTQKMGVYYTKLLPTILKDWKQRINSEKQALFTQLEAEVLQEAFIYLDNYGGEDLQLEEIRDWFGKAKVKIINDADHAISEPEVKE